MRKTLFLLIGFLISQSVWAQQESIANLFKVDYDTPLTIELKDTDEDKDDLIAPVDTKKKKRKNRKVFYGIKTKRGYTRTGFGDDLVLELFHYLKHKDFVGPEEYIQDFYYYDFKRKKIVNSRNIKNPKDVGVLHGHYVKKIGDQVLEEGFYYKGMKHRRWVRYNQHDILMDKAVYWKGWPEESLLSFYDFQKERLREVIPVHFGEREGDYYAFHENGNIAATGTYKFGRKVGIWREYYDNRRLKREVIYPKDPYDFKTRPYISKEWDSAGRVLYDRNVFFSAKR